VVERECFVIGLIVGRRTALLSVKEKMERNGKEGTICIFMSRKFGNWSSR
jgi:hypothetical protein